MSQYMPSVMYGIYSENGGLYLCDLSQSNMIDLIVLWQGLLFSLAALNW